MGLTEGQTGGGREGGEAGERPGTSQGQSPKEGMLPSHMGVQVPQTLCGVRGGLHAGDRLVEDIASGLLGLDTTSGPAFTV